MTLIGPTGATLGNMSVVQPTTPFKICLDLRDPTQVKMQMLSMADAVLYQIVANVGTLPAGTYWGAGSAEGGTEGRWDDFVFEDGPTVSPPVLTNATGSATAPTTASGSVTTDVANGTLYALASTTLPTEATMLASGTQFAITATGVRNVTLTGLTHSTSGYEIYYLHKRSSGENSAILASPSFATPVPLAAPGGSAATTVDGQTVTITYTPTGTVDSVTASLPAHGTPNGAVTQAPKAMTLSGGVWTAVFTAVPPGDYAAPVVLASNADNSSTSITGAQAFYIDDLSGEPEAPETDPPTDTTAPTLSSATATAATHNTSTGSVATNEAGGTLYWLTNTSASATATEVKAGSSQIVSTAGTQSTASSGLSPNTSGYRTHYLHRDPAGNDSTVLTSTAFATPVTPDTTAPTLSAATASANGPTAANASVTTNEATGTLYSLINTSASATAAAVKAGASQVVTATGVQSLTPTGLTAGTTGYRVHFLHRDAAGNDSAVLTTAAFNTPAEPDTLAPVLSAATAAATGPTASSGSVTTDEANGTLYWVTNTNASATASVVKAGSSQPVTASGVQNTTSSGLTANTATYRTHYLHRDAAGNDSTVRTTTAFATPVVPDTTPPVMGGALSRSGLSTTGYTVTGYTATDDVGVTSFERSLDGGTTWASIALAASFPVTSRTPGTTDNVRVRALDAAGNPATPLSLAVTLLQSATVNTDPANQSAVVGGAATFSATFNDAVSRGWQRATAAGTFADVPGEIATSYTTEVLDSPDNGDRIRAFGMGTDDVRVYTDEATLTVSTPVTGVIARMKGIRPSAFFRWLRRGG